MKETLETSFGVFKVEWGVRFGPGRDSAAETGLILEPEFDQADSPRRTWASSAGGIEAFLIRAGVPTDEARSLSSELWEHRWRAEEDHRRRDGEQREYQRVRSDLKEQWGTQTDVQGIRLVRQWIAFVAVVEVGTTTAGSTTRLS